MCLSCTSLAIGNDASIVALEGRGRGRGKRRIGGEETSEERRKGIKGGRLERQENAGVQEIGVGQINGRRRRGEWDK